MTRMLKLFEVIICLLFICFSCQKADNNPATMQNTAEQYADKLLKAKDDAKNAAAATEQHEKDVNRAVDEGEQKNK